MPLDTSKAWEALKTLEEAIAFHETERSERYTLALRDSVIKRFEYTYELCWKLMQRWIRENVGMEAAEPLNRRDLYRQAARNELVLESEAWFRYHRVRNLSSHTYQEENAELALAAAREFTADAKHLLMQLDKSNA